MGADRGQQGIIGVAVLLLLTVIAVGGLTGLLGASVTGGIAQAELSTVGATIAAVTAPTDDPAMRTVVMRAGTLETHPLRLEIVGGGLSIEQEVGALRYHTGEHRLSSEFGTQITSVDGEAVAVRGQRIRRAGDRVYVGVPSVRLRDVDTIAADGRAVRVGLLPRSAMVHRRLPPARYQLRLETHHPSAWTPILEGVGATVQAERRVRAPAVITATFDEPVALEFVSQTVELEVI